VGLAWRGLAHRPSRAFSIAAIVAVAEFLIVAVSAFSLSSPPRPRERSGPTGGWTSIATFAAPTAVNPADADVAAAITQANARLPDYAQLRGWIDFSTAPSVANALLTSNGRLRRDAILSRESDRIDTLYETLSPRDFADEIS
jgi:hypothetical protein